MSDETIKVANFPHTLVVLSSTCSVVLTHKTNTIAVYFHEQADKYEVLQALEEIDVRFPQEELRSISMVKLEERDFTVIEGMMYPKHIGNVVA